MMPALVVSNLWQCSELLFLSLEYEEKFFFFLNIANPNKNIYIWMNFLSLKGTYINYSENINHLGVPLY